jgi:hypothetical protein
MAVASHRALDTPVPGCTFPSCTRYRQSLVGKSNATPANPSISEEVRKTGIGSQMSGDLGVTKAYLEHKTVIGFCDLVVQRVSWWGCPGVVLER